MIVCYNQINNKSDQMFFKKGIALCVDMWYNKENNEYYETVLQNENNKKNK